MAVSLSCLVGEKTKQEGACRTEAKLEIAKQQQQTGQQPAAKAESNNVELGRIEYISLCRTCPSRNKTMASTHATTAAPWTATAATSTTRPRCRRDSETPVNSTNPACRGSKEQAIAAGMCQGRTHMSQNWFNWQVGMYTGWSKTVVGKQT